MGAQAQLPRCTRLPCRLLPDNTLEQVYWGIAFRNTSVDDAFMQQIDMSILALQARCACCSALRCNVLCMFCQVDRARGGSSLGCPLLAAPAAPTAHPVHAALQDLGTTAILQDKFITNSAPKPSCSFEFQQQYQGVSMLTMGEVRTRRE